MSFKNELFKLIRGFGYKVKMYDENGKGPIFNADDFVYMYGDNGDESVMLVYNFDPNRTYNYITLYKSQIINRNVFLDFLQSIKTLAIKNAFSVSIKNFGRNIKPKDFATLPVSISKNDISESFTINGSKMTSNHDKHNARVKIRHKGNVDEKKKNSRSRNIKELFVETKNGERRKINCNNLSVAKSVANYVNSGGELYDETVNNLTDLGNNHKYLKEMSKRDLSEFIKDVDNDDKIRYLVKETYKKMSSFFRKMSNRKRVLEVNELNYLNSESIDFTKEYFNEYINDDYLCESLAKCTLFVDTEKEKGYNDNLDYLFGPDELNKVYSKDLILKNPETVKKVLKELKYRIHERDKNIDLDFVKEVLTMGEKINENNRIE